MPASLRAPNLITVGAVDQAGDPTTFTSYGATVVVYADGFRVPSVVPGGRAMRFSGTSMASPNVVNLAAKLLALDPALSPAQNQPWEPREVMFDPGTRMSPRSPGKPSLTPAQNEP